MAEFLKEGSEVLLDRWSRIQVGFGWETYPRQYSAGFFSGLLGAGKPQAADCDGSALLFDYDGKPVGGKLKTCCIYYGNTNLYNFTLAHNGDNLTGIGSGDDETIFIDLKRMPDEVDHIALTFDFFKTGKKMTFGKLQEVCLRIVDDVTEDEICRFEPEDTGVGGKALLGGWLYRSEDGWVFRAEGRSLPEAQKKEDLMSLEFA